MVASRPADDTAKYVTNIINDTKYLDSLFYTIARSADAGRINHDTSISLYNLVSYYESPDNALLGIVKDKYVLHVSHALVSGKQSYNNIKLKQFKRLVLTMYLCSHIWKVFEIMDVIEVDRKISREEFMNAKNTLPQVQGIEFLSAIDMDEWMAEFKVLDKDNSGFVSFQELCEYTIQNIVNPRDFIEDDEEEMIISRPLLSPKALLEMYESQQEEFALEEARIAKENHDHPVTGEKGLSFLTDHSTEDKDLRQIIEDELVSIMRKMHDARYQRYVERNQKREQATAAAVAEQSSPSRNGMLLTPEQIVEKPNLGDEHMIKYGAFQTKVDGTKVMDVVKLDKLKH